MFEIWLKTVELEGIKSPPKINDIVAIVAAVYNFLLELMMIFLFLTGTGVFVDILNCLHMA